MTNQADLHLLRQKSDAPAIIAAISTITTIGIGLGLSFPLCSLLLEYRSNSATIIGANTAFATSSGLIIIPYCTAIARRLGLANTLVGSCVVAALAFVALFLFQSLAAWFALRFIFHAALFMVFILCGIWISASVPRDNRGIVLGIYATVLCAGFAIGPAILMVTGTDGILPFAIGAGLMVVSMVPALATRHRQPTIKRNGTAGTFFILVTTLPISTLGIFIFGCAEMAIATLLPVFGLHAGFDERNAVLFLALIGVGNVVFQIPMGVWGNRFVKRGYTRKPLLLICSLVGAMGAMLLPQFVAYPPVLHVNFLIWGAISTGIYTVGLAHIASRMSGDDNFAQANAAYGFSYTAGAIIGPQMAGLVMDLSPESGFPSVLALAFLILGALLVGRGDILEKN